MSDPRTRRATVVGAQLAAAAAGTAAAMLSGGPILARVVMAMLAGTAGYLLGGPVAGGMARAAHRARLAPPGRAVYPLRRLPPAAAAGGKGLGLARLAQSGFRVPEGVVVVADAFTGDDLPGPARADLEAAVRRLGTGPFAVRSSAPGEDAATTSFAGAFETRLDVPAADVPAAVLAVHRSAGSARVRAYAAAHGVAAPGELAVVVQRMVAADQAGVLFTADPITGDLDRMVGNVISGAGEALVSGSADASSFTLHRPDGGFDGPAGLGPLARQLHDVAHAVETVAGGLPQDIEWAIAKGRLWLLQARPVTTMTGWNPVTAERNDSLTGTCLWSATNLTEANPEPQTPLTVSFVGYLQDHGGPSMKLRGREMAGSIAGRPYANLTVQVSARGPKAAADPRRAYAGLAGLWGELPADLALPVLPLTRADWRDEGIPLLATLLRLQWHHRRLGRFLDTSAAGCRDLSARIGATPTPADLLRLWRDALLPACLRSFWAVIAATGGELDPLEAELRQRVGVEDAAALLANVSGLAGDLASLGPASGLQDVLAGRLSRQDYLAAFGHRGHNEIELAWPRPAEDPRWLDHALGLAVSGAEVAGLLTAREEAHAAALGRLRAAHPGAARGLERRLRRRARRAALRERVRSESVRWTGVARAFAVRAGELLGIGDDVFLLTLPELLAALAGDSSPFTHFAVRRATVARQRGLPVLPAFILGRFDPDTWTGGGTAVATAAAGPMLTGAPGSLGVAEGLVRRLDRVEDVDQLRPGEVLVTHLTNIGWTPVFPRAGAIVTDLGAPLSHAAIVARELGLPAVVGCGDATTRLSTGDLVRVDGARGTVELLRPAR